MASRIVLGIIIIAMLGATGFFVMNYKIESHYENGKLAYMKITPRGSSAEPATPAPDAPPAANLPPPSNRLTFRIAAFNLGGLDENKLSSPRIADILSRTLARFELIAVQGLRQKPGRGGAAGRSAQRPKRSAIRIRHLPHAAARRHRALLGILLR